MERKLVLTSIIMILLTSMLGVAFRVEKVQAAGTIYIRADGRIDPPTANITSADNVTYYFTDNNYDEIVVERSNIIIDGNGYTLQGDGSGYGFSLSSINNVTIRNTNIKGFIHKGVYLSYSSYNTITENNITNNNYGIYLKYSNNTSIDRNNITNNDVGVALDSSSNNTISRNNITNSNTYGVALGFNSNNTISGNNITNNGGGVWFFDSSYNTIAGNNITNNDVGIYLHAESSNNVIYHNNFIDNTVQVDSFNSTNVWDNGYPSGGNYWSDYTDVDIYSGTYQNDTGSDGIGDAPYVIDANNTDNYPLMKTYAGPHDIGITSVNTSKTIVGEDYSLNIKVKIINYGEHPETFNVTIKANSTTIKTQTVTLTNRNSTTITFTWNTTGWDKGNYTITAKATPLPGETDTADNTLVDSWVFVTIPGDVDGDRDVDIYDIVRMSGIYGVSKPDPLYDPNCDIDGDGDIDIYDIVAAAGNYGKSW